MLRRVKLIKSPPPIILSTPTAHHKFTLAYLQVGDVGELMTEHEYIMSDGTNIWPVTFAAGTIWLSEEYFIYIGDPPVKESSE